MQVNSLAYERSSRPWQALIIALGMAVVILSSRFVISIMFSRDAITMVPDNPGIQTTVAVTPPIATAPSQSPVEPPASDHAPDGALAVSTESDADAAESLPEIVPLPRPRRVVAIPVPRPRPPIDADEPQPQPVQERSIFDFLFNR